MKRQTQSYDEPHAGMEMPTHCNSCGGWFDLLDGGAPGNSRIIICPDCYDRETEISELTEQIEDLEYEMDNGSVGKREGKKQIRELKAKIEKLSK